MGASISTLLLAAGCAWPQDPVEPPDPPQAGCSDQDGDGFGIGPDCLGPDCNDSNPSISLPSDCEARCTDEHAPGCPCDIALERHFESLIEVRATLGATGDPPRLERFGACPQYEI